MKFVLMVLGLVALNCSAELITPSKIYDGAVQADMDAWNAAMETKLTVAADTTIGITNGTFSVGGNTTSVGKNATLVAFEGATLNFAASANSKAFGLNQPSARYVLDGATFNVVTKNVQRYFGNGSSSRPTGCAWELTNGSTLDSSNGGASGEYRWIVGTSNTMTFVDSTFKEGNYGLGGDRYFHFHAADSCTLSATRSTLELDSVAKKFGFIDSTNSRAVFTDVTLTGSETLEFAETSIGNTAEFLGTEGSVSFKTVNMNGTCDTLRLANANFSPTVNVGGTSNCLAIAGADYSGKITGNNPVAPTVLIESGAVVSNQYLRTTSDFAPYVDNSTIDVCGGEFKLARYLKFDGEGKTIRVRDGGKFYIGLEPKGTADARNALRFTSGSTSGCTISIEDNGVFESHTAINRTAADYNWTGCPNTKIVFKGSNPRFNVQVVMDATYALVLGTAAETDLTDPVKLRFEVPAGNYGAAPLQILEAERPAIIYGNQPIEVSVADEMLKGAHGKIVIPLVYDVNGFGVALDAARLAKLKENATIPAGSKFVVVDDAEGNGKTLCLSIPSNTGLSILLR